MNDLMLFEQKNLALFQNLADLNKKKKELEKTEKDVKEQIKLAMNENGIKQFKNDVITITNVEPSETIGIDMKKVQEKEPELYDGLLKDYPKVSKKAGYVRFVVK